MPTPKSFANSVKTDWTQAETIMAGLLTQLVAYMEAHEPAKLVSSGWPYGVQLNHPWVSERGLVYTPRIWSAANHGDWAEMWSLLPSAGRRVIDQAHPLVTPALVAAYIMGGIEALQGTNRRAHYSPALWEHWQTRVTELRQLTWKRVYGKVTTPAIQRKTATYQPRSNTWIVMSEDHRPSGWTQGAKDTMPNDIWIYQDTK